MRMLEFTTYMAPGGIPCRNNCTACPQALLGAAYTSSTRMLSLEAFKQILRSVPDDVEIAFSGFAEPMLNPATPGMCKLCHDAGRKVHLNTTLIGLSPAGAKLIPANAFPVIIHVPDQTVFKAGEGLWIRQNKLWRDAGHTQSQYTCLAPLADGSIKSHLEELGIPVSVSTLTSRGGTLWQRDEQTVTACSDDRWHRNVVLPNSGVYLCCMTFDLSVKLGNLLTDDYQKIYDAGEQCRLNPPAVCRRCEWGVT